MLTFQRLTLNGLDEQQGEQDMHKIKKAFLRRGLIICIEEVLELNSVLSMPFEHVRQSSSLRR